MTIANVHNIHNLKDEQWKSYEGFMLGDKGYLSAEIQQNQFEELYVFLGIPCRLNQKKWCSPIEAYKRFRKRNETFFSQLNNQFMMIRNYAK